MPLLPLLISLIFSVLPLSMAVAAEACRDEIVDGARYAICSFEPGPALRIYHSDSEGKPFGGFDSLARQLWKEHHTLTFAMNGGMYHDDLSPVGLHIEYGREQAPVSTKAGWGNFHLLPNGVFYVKDGRAAVAETTRYLKRNPAPDFATQSGPMLVIGGKLHPKFLPDSDSLKIRNGVGVDAEGRVHFVISRDWVNFHQFARLFRDRLGCANALYLDGTISSMFAPELGRNDRWMPLGPIIAVIGTRP
ncbi:phosphodiester glycosidase family protein [Rhizobium sp. CAU 1783]